MNYRNNSKKQFNKRTWNDEVGKDAGRPPVEDGKRYDDMISIKALKDLPRHPVTLIADPYTNALPGSMPYPLLNRYNRIMGGRYSGDRNLDGGNVQQYANSPTSGFLNIFDSALMKLNLNYRYLPILATDTARGSDMIDEMRKAISEATSMLGSTIFSNRLIYNYMIETDLPMGTAKTKVVTDSDGEEHTVYYEIQDVIYAIGLIYQLHLQSAILAFNQFNAFRTKQGEMLRMSFNRETPALTAYFGLMNKKAFLSLWDSLAYTIEGEYVDLDFMRQTNMLGLIASRRSESMNDSILEISSVFNYPGKAKIYVSGENAYASTTIPATPIFDMDRMRYEDAAGTSATFYQACDDLMEKMTVNDTLLWARNKYKTGGTSDNDRYNACKFDLDVITKCMTYFKEAMGDFRTVLDKMSTTDINQWSRGLKLKVINDIDSAISQNLIVDNIYSMVLGGCEEVKYDDNTKRWSLFTLWNQYYGIPEHDTYSGGSFLTLSTKTIQLPSDTDSNVGYLPIAFNVKASTTGTLCRVINRLGFDCPISYEVVTISSNYVLSRLVPLYSQANYKMRVPKVQLDDDYDRYSNITKSFLYKWMLQICGVASIPTSSTTVDYGIDSDLFSVYDFQIEDFTNEVITYARSRAIFRANNIDTSNLGFFGIAADKK